MTRLGRISATTIAISAATLVLLGSFLPIAVFQGFSLLLVSWAGLVVAFALLLGVVNLLRVHLLRVQNRDSNRLYSVVLILALTLTLIFGRNGPGSAGGQAIFDYILRPLEATLFALMAFFILSAAYRAFRVQNFESFLFVAFAIIVLLGQVPVGYQLGQAFADIEGLTFLQFLSDLPLVKDWVLQVPAMAGMRGILLGVALGTIATGLRIVMGIDRPYADVDQAKTSTQS